ncbi:hypothetical protein MMC25_006201 [Agyrium rufum]|nr:hypothetical protein [Agyrium rufum]
MSKRKRDSPTTTTGRQSTHGQLDEALEKGKRSLFRALKLARGFERQKLGRRQKNAQDERSEGDIARLAAEVTTLKSLDLLSIGELHLYKTMLKTKSIAESSNLPSHIVEKAEALQKPHDTAFANVTARLFSSKPVQAAIDETLLSVRRALGLPEQAPAKKKRMRASDYQKNDAGVIDAETIAQHDASANEKHSGTTSDEQSWTGFSDSDEVDNGAETASDVSSEEGHDDYATRLGNESDESLEDDLDDYTGRDLLRESSFSPVHEPPDKPLVTSEPASIHRPMEQNSIHKPEVGRRGIAKLPTKSTTFLPSLMGGYYAGSESGSEDDTHNGRYDNSDDDDNPASIQPRKNRRGQQARRQLWEKKFGSGAKHLHGQGPMTDSTNRTATNRDEGWDLKKGAQAAESDRRKNREAHLRGRGRTDPAMLGDMRPSKQAGEKGGRFRGDTSRDFRSTSRAAKNPTGRDRENNRKKETEDDRPLHPSWEAAKKAKERNLAITEFKGKKITFD